MKIQSIRRFLTFGLVLAIVAGLALSAVVGYREAAHEVEEVFDAALGQTARVLQGLVTRELLAASAEHLAAVLADTAFEQDIAAAGSAVTPFGHKYEKKLAFQVLSGPDEVILRSASAPQQLLAPLERGFSRAQLNGFTWRVFTLHEEDEALWFHVAEREDVRGELTRDIAVDSIVPVVIAIPLIGLLVWWIVGVGLVPLDRIARALAAKAPSSLTPLPLDEVPVEIAPLVQSLNDLFGRLEQAFEHERRFTGDAAHELRTPIAALKVHLTNARRAVEPEAREHSLAQIESGARRMERLVEQLLTLNRVDETAALDGVERVDVGEVCRAVAEELREPAASKSITLECHACGNPCTFEGNAVLLETLVRNVVDNAIRYAPDGGRVVVACEAHNGRIELTIEDNGPGIPAPARVRALERFYRVPGSEQAGSGLGLAIARSIAKAHGGTITLGTPAGGQGLAVRVSLPSV